MRRLIVGLAAAALLAVPATAFAHEEINPNSIVTGRPTFFTLSAANEKTVNLVKITLVAPAGINFGSSTRSPAGWTVNRQDTQIAWTGGAVKPDGFEQWGYEIESADQPGTFNYTVTMGFADGTSEDVKVPILAHPPVKTGAPTVSPLVTKAKTRANVAIVLSVLAAIAAIVALVLGSRTRRPAGAEGAEQNW